jgi:transcriptional regulator with XRE-family HTH domain
VPPSCGDGPKVVQTIYTPEHRQLVALIRAARHDAGLTQQQLGYCLYRTQQWVAHLECGQRRIIVDDFLALAEVLGFDPSEVLAESY